MNSMTTAGLVHTGVAWRTTTPQAVDSQSWRTLVHFDGGNLLRIRDGAGTRLTAAAGLLWITEEGSLKDTVLMPRERHQIENHGLTLVFADRPAQLALEVPAGTGVPRSVHLFSAAGEQRIAVDREMRLLAAYQVALSGVIQHVCSVWRRLWAVPYPSVPTGGWFEHDTVYSSRRTRGAGSARVLMHEATPANAREALMRSYPSVYY
jgi:hypothetical protein